MSGAAAPFVSVPDICMALGERFELSSAKHTGFSLTAGLAITSNPAPYQARLPQLE